MNRIARFITVLAASLSLAGAPAFAADAPADGNSLGLGSGQQQLPPAAMLRPAVPQIDIAGDPMLGDAHAPLTVVEFMDYECPYCQGFALETMPQLKQHWIATGKVRYIARDFPLPKHKRAAPAAIAAACAREQGKFWEMHDALLAAQGQLREEDIAGHAKALELDLARFQTCRGEERHSWRLGQDFAAARAMGVNSTPSFLVGASAGNLARGRLLVGVENYAELDGVLSGYLKEVSGQEPAAEVPGGEAAAPESGGQGAGAADGE